MITGIGQWRTQDGSRMYDGHVVDVDGSPSFILTGMQQAALRSRFVDQLAGEQPAVPLDSRQMRDVGLSLPTLEADAVRLEAGYFEAYLSDDQAIRLSPAEMKALLI